jgi:hypothetical protein
MVEKNMTSTIYEKKLDADNSCATKRYRSMENVVRASRKKYADRQLSVHPLRVLPVVIVVQDTAYSQTIV